MKLLYRNCSWQTTTISVALIIKGLLCSSYWECIIWKVGLAASPFIKCIYRNLWKRGLVMIYLTIAFWLYSMKQLSPPERRIFWQHSFLTMRWRWRWPLQSKYLCLKHFPCSSFLPCGPSESQAQSTFLNCCHLMEHLDLTSLPAKNK